MPSLPEPSPNEQEELLALLLAEEGLETAAPIIAPTRRPEYLELSFAQKRLWFLNQLEPGSPTYNIPIGLRLTGQLNTPALEQSLQEIVRRHESLRTTFKMVDDQPVQVIAPPQVAESLVRLTVQRCTAADVPRLAVTEASRPFNLAQGPLLRATLLRLDESNHVLLLTLHHIIADGWSLGVLFEELVALYPALAAGQPSPLSPLPIQYADFAQWQQRWLQGQIRRDQLAYWRKQLTGAVPVLQLPMAHSPKPGRQKYRPGAIETFGLSPALTADLRRLSLQSGSTLFMTLLAAFTTLLYRYTHQTDLSVGTLIANRNWPEIKGLIGVFINALTLRTDLSGQPTFADLLQRVRQVALEAYAHQDLPFEMLVEELHPERDLYHTPLFQVMFVLQNAPLPAIKLPGLSISSFDIDNATAVYDLIFELTEQTDGLTGSIRYDTNLFDAPTIRRMIGHFEVLLTAITANPHQSISALSILTQAETQQLLVDWNNTRQYFPLDYCAHQMFEAQAAQTPQAIAAVCAGEQLTYQQLNQRANHLAWRLIQAGVGPEVVVSLLAERGLDLLTMILAVFKAGGAYLPLDPLHPTPRLVQILERSRSPLVLITPEFAPALAEALNSLPAAQQPQVLELDPLWPQLTLTQNPPLRVTPGHLAYIIYTSGSTGMPKGAMVEHMGMLNHLYAKITDLNLTTADRVAQNSSQCFDISVWQFLAVLLVGGTVHIYPNPIAYHPMHLLDQVRRDQLTVLQVVPSMLRTIIQEITETTRPDLSALRWIVPTGEALTTELCRQWLQLYPQIPMMNAYGSTECSDDQCHHPIFQPPPADSEMPTMPIGRPLANTQVYILDRQLAPAPIGVTGELYIGGVGVGRGYLNEPLRTAQVFIPNPFGPQPGCRLYKTGDSARYLPNGVIEFLGRVDFMVKIRGFRIELGEIEAALEQHPAIDQAIVMVPDNQHLVAYVTTHQPLTADELRHYLKQKLPDYMTPSFFVFLEAMPLNANGKVDRRALPRPDPTQAAAENYLAPRTPIERALADLWANILGLERVGRRDNFFDLGGHSLLAVRLMAQIHKQFGADLPLATLFEAATIEHLAEVLQQGSQPALPIPLVAIQPILAGAESTRRPFFFVHPADGTVFSYVNLARRLGQEQPFYGLQAVGLQDEQSPQTQIEAMAADYIQAIQAVQPHGPYLLGGWSMGSVVAFEMAQQLYRSGQPVALLVLLDHLAPPLYQTAPSTDFLDDQKLLAAFLQDLRRRFAQDLPALPDDLWQLSTVEQLNLMLAQAKMLEVVLPDGGLLQIHRLLQVFKTNVRAMWDYEPQPYPGQIILYKAAEMATPDEAESVERAGLTLGWERFSARPVKVHTVPGDHYTMLTEPHVQVLAGQLRAYLDQAQ